MPGFVFTVLDAIVAASPGASIDDDFFTELKTNLQLTGTIQNGNSTFNGVTGRAITITEMTDALYFVGITPTASPAGNLGEIWVVRNSTTQFTVYNSGSATTAFAWTAIE